MLDIGNISFKTLASHSADVKPGKERTKRFTDWKKVWEAKGAKGHSADGAYSRFRSKARGNPWRELRRRSANKLAFRRPSRCAAK